MAYFDDCLQKREEILANGEVMTNLRTYFTFPPQDNNIPLEHLGSGLSNSHYSIGKLDSGLWVVIRESKNRKRYNHKIYHIHC